MLNNSQAISEKEEVFFSIVVPVYNVEKYIISCLNSIKKQSYRNFEAIIVNDGATDNSGILLKTFFETSPSNFILIEQENKGLSVARNNGFERSSGQYILFLDSDDTIEGDTLHSLNEMLIANPDVDYINFARSYMYEGQGFVSRSFVDLQFEEDYKVFEGSEILKQLLNYKNISTSAIDKVYSRSFLEKFSPNIFEPGVNFEDHIFCFASAQHLNRVISSKKKFLNYLIRGDSIMRTASERMVNDYIVMMDFFYQRRDQYLKDDITPEEVNQHLLIQVISFFRALHDIKTLSAIQYKHLVFIFKEKLRSYNLFFVLEKKYTLKRGIVAGYCRSFLSNQKVFNDFFFGIVDNKK
ncbi:glycosyltransferase family 2 protein [Sphingobacterium chungjuense]|uniref:glycosyltransferase family 2 protein n=1 Tax=Sphingobacterium chungjuense TaxID=2675553 RepID=UPI00140C2486|nr:glycosyltransferase family 2 protein [Sphingobacterium chungjuense]